MSSDCPPGEDFQHHDLVDPHQRLRLLRLLSGPGHQLRQVKFLEECFRNNSKTYNFMTKL